MSENVPSATVLRRQGRLWPQILNDDDVMQEYSKVDPAIEPISARMLREEVLRRGLLRD